MREYVILGNEAGAQQGLSSMIYSIRGELQANRNIFKVSSLFSNKHAILSPDRSSKRTHILKEIQNVTRNTMVARQIRYLFR